MEHGHNAQVFVPDAMSWPPTPRVAKMSNKPFRPTARAYVKARGLVDHCVIYKRCLGRPDLAVRVDDPGMPGGFYLALNFEAMDRELAARPIRPTRPQPRPPDERPAPAGVGYAGG